MSASPLPPSASESGGATASPASHAAPAGDLESPALLLNRELSWLAFNERVLAQAQGTRHPLLERVKFLAIAANNLDEFYMVRLASVARAYRSGLEAFSPDGLTTAEQLHVARERAGRMLDELHVCWEQTLRPLLAQEGIVFLERAEYSDPLSRHLARYFSTMICPVLTPLAFDPGHPFPQISNRSKNIAVVVRHQGRTRFARVKVPDVLPRFVPLPPELGPAGTQAFAFLEDVIAANLGELFPGTEVRSAHVFHVVRDTDMVLPDTEVEDLLESVDRSLKQLRHGALTLLHVEQRMPPRVLATLQENFEVEDGVVRRCRGRLALADWMEITKIHRPRLKDPVFTPRTVWRVTDADTLFQRMQDEEQLVHHPFDSFAAIETFVQAAVRDPHVVAIKIALYRVGRNSPLIDLLIEAADRGKQVAVLVELKARFDERNNIDWATRMEAAGIHVVYGLLDLKTHCKVCLVVRQEAGGIARYAHIGTGNYNRTTAALYTDVGLFTTRPDLVADASEVFNYLTGYSTQRCYRALLVAPVNLRQQLTGLIEREITHARSGTPAHVIVKVNAVSDVEMIRSLYRASQAGVKIDLIVRGICCLRPGVAGVSESIHVRSIVGRFLEHSRVYYFRNGGQEELFIGSADLMERNLDRRVEVLAPVSQPTLRHELRHILDAYLRDNTCAFVLRADGSYVATQPAEGERPFGAQDYLMEAARHQADGWEDPFEPPTDEGGGTRMETRAERPSPDPSRGAQPSEKPHAPSG
jgi:polyphosphate kinase